jgi:hypothetical protein
VGRDFQNKSGRAFSGGCDGWISIEHGCVVAGLCGHTEADVVDRKPHETIVMWNNQQLVCTAGHLRITEMFQPPVNIFISNLFILAPQQTLRYFAKNETGSYSHIEYMVNVDIYNLACCKS